LTAEAELFGRYLTKDTPSKKIVTLYEKAMNRTANKVSKSDEKALAFVGKCPWSIGFIDAGLAIVRPQSEVRRRLYVMFSILEATPEYATQFLPQDQPWWYVFVVVWAGIKAVVKALLGVALVKVVAR
jgi:hypothetical protein